ncbi:DUF397 domain-containing protein [Streptomyces sp. WAC 06783]|uniref:DUF397 domain-containing protein n=1 Tax=Streptomyces sp. WAC 06783 TaxID=2203211 RepID=UPI000F738CBB|nr:DUF397 domain-containing protein [Streptomyces sp. WAC 06783]
MSQKDWQISTHCQAGNSCVGVRRSGEAVAMRESIHPSEVMVTTPESLRAFIASVKGGALSHSN